MASFIGIDLGTTYSVISYIDKTGRPKIIHNNDNGDNTTPSCIKFKGDSVLYVGEEAKIQIGLSDNVASRFKRDMDSQQKHVYDGHTHTPTTLSSEILKKLYQDALTKNVATSSGDSSDVVITVPANFANVARVATKKAAKLAGIKEVKLIDEPTAAALYYAFESGGSLNGYYAVYDLGGGTFDISIVKIQGFDVEVIETDGIARLGGDDFDKTLQKIVQKKYLEDTGEELEEEDFTKTDAEKQKKSLSTRDVNVRINRKNYPVTQDEFQDEIRPRIKKTIRVCKSVLKKSGLEIKDIEEVFLVGGSTRIPSVEDAVKKAFKMGPKSTINVDEVVALGASVYSAHRANQSKLNPAQKSSIEKINVQDVTPAYFGFICNKFDKKRKKDVETVSIIIPKNTKRPCGVTKQYVTLDDNQINVPCSVTSSMNDSKDPSFVTKVWDGSLGPLPGGRPRGQPIDVTFKFDVDGIMFASFVDLSSGKKKDIKLSDIEENVDT